MTQHTATIIGRSGQPNDYVGVRTHYLLKTFVQNGISARVWDWNLRSSDTTLDADSIIWLPWVQELNCGWLRLLRCFNGKRYLWTERHDWCEQVRARIMSSNTCDISPSDVFTYMCYTSLDGVTTWGMQAGHTYWPPLVHTDCLPLIDAASETPTILFDSIWPYRWADGQYTARDTIAALFESSRLPAGVCAAAIAAHADDLEPAPLAWANDIIPNAVAHALLLERLATSAVYVTTHHELLGLQQFEALACGTPVVVARTHAPLELLRPGAPGVFVWDIVAPDGAPLPIAEATENLRAALALALAAGSDTAERAAIKRYHAAAWGADAWWQRCGSFFTGSNSHRNLDFYEALRKITTS